MVLGIVVGAARTVHATTLADYGFVKRAELALVILFIIVSQFRAYRTFLGFFFIKHRKRAHFLTLIIIFVQNISFLTFLAHLFLNIIILRFGTRFTRILLRIPIFG